MGLITYKPISWFEGVRQFGRIAAVLILTGTAAHADARYDSLVDAAVSVKHPGSTPLVAIVRADTRLVAVGTHGVIIISDDNGVTWRQAAVPVDLTLTSAFFSSKTDVWACGHYGVILHSADGGLSWTKFLDGRDVIHDLSAISDQAQAAQASSPDAVLKLRIATAFEKAGPSKPFLAIGSCGEGMLIAGQQDMAMFSPDKAKAWQSWTSQIDNPNFQNIYGIVGSGNTTLLIGEAGLVLKSDANCSGFKPLPGPYTATLFGAIFIGQRGIVLYGLDGGLFTSNDAGATWTTISMPADSVIAAGVSLASGQVLVGTLDGSLYLSDAGRDHFHQLAVTEPFQIADMVVASNGNIVAVGNGGAGIIASSLIR